ncbi:hypothetical protein [uncultured Bradyrhizobium sp.]|uniref:hypothetical protein n=1 Tax=uncultured Bradyrhizobium sp. TaxID=199684 RepID=UPI00262F1355|nr:hypothetical protein [uncultured Bradyrhizobium sp.]
MFWGRLTLSDLNAAVIWPTMRRLAFLIFEIARVHGCSLKRALGTALPQERGAKPCRDSRASQALSAWKLASIDEPPLSGMCEVTVVSLLPSLKLAPFVLDLACLTEGRRRQRAVSLLSLQQPLPTFFPWRCAPFLAEDKKVGSGCPLLRAGPFGVQVDRLRSVASHRGRDGRGPNT